MKDFPGLRVGYAPCSDTLEAPGDRRRFCYYARKRKIEFERADPSKVYDIVMVSAAADISAWSRYQRGNAKVVFDLTDSYLAIPKLDPKGLFRGLAKFVTRQNRHLLWSYAGGIRDMCSRADAVVCTTAEQRQDIFPHCRNVHTILDFHGSVVRTTKDDYSSRDVFNIVWEGLPGNLVTMRGIADVLGELQKQRPIAIHAITKLSYGQYLNGQFIRARTEDLVRKMPIPHYLYAWSEQTCSHIVCACDLAVIPIPLQDPMYSGKPENKLHLFWRMGMPTLVSATPAYTRAMQAAGIHMACDTSRDWQNALEKYSTSEKERKDAGQRGKEFVQRHCSEEQMLAQWDEVFSSVLGNPSFLNDTKTAAGTATCSV